MDSHADLTQHDIRIRIGRLRRQIDGRVHSLDRDTRRLVAWRTWVQRYPGYASLAALGAGLSVSAGLRRVPWTRWLARLVLRRSADGLLQRLAGEIGRFWTANDEPGRSHHD